MPLSEFSQVLLNTTFSQFFYIALNIHLLIKREIPNQVIIVCICPRTLTNEVIYLILLCRMVFLVSPDLSPHPSLA